ncbi:hypothetical protein [Hyalangium gracile]|uniref:hypothetical protein n=1 Tax=Hyalangium gracile TaxID=394092 RepID=UPI001CCD09AF|nr:hypothetical protein [Hyalangium gracile]
MRRAARRSQIGLALGLLLLLGACGKGAVFLTIEAEGPEGTLRIPDDVDRVAVRVTNVEGTAVLLEKEYALTGDNRFPLTLGLEPGPETGELIRVEVTAFKGEETVGDAAAVVSITRQQEAAVTLRIMKT